MILLVVPMLVMAQEAGGQVIKPVKKQQTTATVNNKKMVNAKKKDRTQKRDEKNNSATPTKQDYCLGCKKYKPFTEFSNNSHVCKGCSNLALEQEKNGYIDLGLPFGTL